MLWPEKPTCHAGAPMYGHGEPVWREPRVEAPADDYATSQPFRTCSYCGSIHPEDLAKHLETGATLHGADWKYGWPHKFYVEGIPNPLAGQTVITGKEYTAEHPNGRPLPGQAPATSFAKFYNEHLQDAGLDDEAFARIAALLAERGGVTFTRDEAGRLKYSAPSYGYQR